MFRVLALVAAATLLAGSSAFADETVTTATPSDAHPPGAGAPAPGPLVPPPARRASEGDVLMTACGPEPVNADGVAAMTPHGQVSVGTGTHGYREVGGSVCQPLPGGAWVAVSADSSRIGR
jgi:hypothetical protein